MKRRKICGADRFARSLLQGSERPSTKYEGLLLPGMVPISIFESRETQNRCRKLGWKSSGNLPERTVPCPTTRRRSLSKRNNI
jgi:hypothetical protein